MSDTTEDPQRISVDFQKKETDNLECTHDGLAILHEIADHQSIIYLFGNKE